MNSREDFASLAYQHDGDGLGLYRVTRKKDFPITVADWSLEAQPYADDGDAARRTLAWAHNLVGYNAWATSVGRPVMNEGDYLAAGALAVAEDVLQMMLSWPIWRDPDTDFSSWSQVDLEWAIAQIHTRNGLAGMIRRQDPAPGQDDRVEDLTQVASAMEAELHRRTE